MTQKAFRRGAGSLQLADYQAHRELSHSREFFCPPPWKLLQVWITLQPLLELNMFSSQWLVPFEEKQQLDDPTLETTLFLVFFSFFYLH